MLSDRMLDLILEELELEKDEEFEITFKNTITKCKSSYRINKNGLEYCYDDHWDRSINLGELLSGEYEIIKLPFVPEINETYYVPDISIAYLYFKTWNYNTKHCKHRIEHEICFRTKQEAIAKAKEWLKLIKEGNELNE